MFGQFLRLFILKIPEMKNKYAKKYVAKNMFGFSKIFVSWLILSDDSKS
jgi:hypothetical protein